jgi:ABC-type antimicrobial peptide transport system permease subunit
MFANYLTIAWRNIIRHKAHTAINITGLALGLTCCIFVFLWVQDERGIDNFHHNADRLYSAWQTVTSNGKIDGSYNTPTHYDPLKKRSNVILQDLSASVPAVERVAIYEKGYELPWGHPESFRVGEKILRLKGSRADTNFLQVFSFPLVRGNAATALKDIHSIAISRKMAALFFASPAAAMGKTVRYENRQDFVVTAVFEDVPAQSSLQFDFLLPWDAQKQGLLEYADNNFATYILLRPTADVRRTETQINQFLATRLDQQQGIQVHIGLQRFGDQYLHDTFVNGQPQAGRIAYVRLFSSIAIFILLIACINFMNLSTARSVQRAKEVGLRKVVGSTRGALIIQFLSEALLFAFLAMLLAIGLLALLLPAFNDFIGKQIPLPLPQSSFWVSLIMLIVLTGLIAGSYPALYLSSLQPIRTLKGVLRFTRGAVWFRKGLTVFQFVLSIVLVIATLVITRQTQYVQNARLGYDRENLIYVRIEGDLTKERNYLSFKQLALGLPGITMIDRSTEEPQEMNFVMTDSSIKWEGKDKNIAVGIKPASVGYDFVRIMHMDIVAGRDFSRLQATDSVDAFLVNEEAVKEMGLKDPIGKWVSAWKKKGHIIGVLKDYHTQSLREAITPVLLDVKEYEDFGVIIARTSPGQTKQALASLAKLYAAINPGYAFSYQFVDKEYKKLYTSEQIISKLSILFATLAIVISCLGLLGLVMFAAQQRTKEIGIRKVLGASIGQIFGLFSVDFLRLIILAFLIAGPLGWYTMSAWLHDFAYRIDLSWWIFVLAGFIALLIAMLTMGWQALSAARANPVSSLRAE